MRLLSLAFLVSLGSSPLVTSLSVPQRKKQPTHGSSKIMLPWHNEVHRLKLSTPKPRLCGTPKFSEPDGTFEIYDGVRKQIMDEIHQIEKDHAVKVLYACESGSRAWGFPSANSDYDVRFLYVHPTDWYLSVELEQLRDVIELPIYNDLDINGWDLRKALKLFEKSNPPLLEWLGSPIVYLEQYTTAQKMRDLAPKVYSPVSCMYHYYSMAKSNFRSYLRGDRIRTKKYFYVLRPLLAMMWLERQLGVVPTEFQALLEGTLSDGELKTAIKDLIEEKRSGAEMDEGPVIPVISQFLEDQFVRLEAERFEKRMQKVPVEQLNQIFRETLEEVWSS